ncbi:hypothetical protein MA16_Dca022201 [Dendrobium catenatum]|uniref:Uncharacterized protein n=1 Tax=Dendrobium catenatum TaxID=906689 RepID=A0A2I0VID7_9ASPA|nr:hypothetical protein MA16_Dca022201 [Dendrobium catenatum]
MNALRPYGSLCPNGRVSNGIVIREGEVPPCRQVHDEGKGKNIMVESMAGKKSMGVKRNPGMAILESSASDDLNLCVNKFSGVLDTLKGLNIEDDLILMKVLKVGENVEDQIIDPMDAGVQNNKVNFRLRQEGRSFGEVTKAWSKLKPIKISFNRDQVEFSEDSIAVKLNADMEAKNSQILKISVVIKVLANRPMEVNARRTPVASGPGDLRHPSTGGGLNPTRSLPAFGKEVLVENSYKIQKPVPNVFIENINSMDSSGLKRGVSSFIALSDVEMGIKMDKLIAESNLENVNAGDVELKAQEDVLGLEAKMNDEGSMLKSDDEDLLSVRHCEDGELNSGNLIENSIVFMPSDENGMNFHSNYNKFNYLCDIGEEGEIIQDSADEGNLGDSVTENIDEVQLIVDREAAVLNKFPNGEKIIVEGGGEVLMENSEDRNDSSTSIKRKYSKQFKGLGPIKYSFRSRRFDAEGGELSPIFN